MKYRSIFDRAREFYLGGKNRALVLAKLINELNLETYVEVGVWEGDTAQYLLKHTCLKEMWLIDPYNEKLGYEGGNIAKATQTKLNIAKKLMLQRIAYFKDDGITKIHTIFKPSVEAATLFKKNCIDLVFIDAQHSYKEVKNDINAWLPIVKQNGFLTGHDYNLRWRDGVVKAVDEIFKDEITLYDDAVWLIQKK